MVNSLVSGLSGLRVHQQLIDVVGNNLANSNTPGFKGSRATFAEILTALLRTGSAPTATIGGVNPQQIGLGVRLGTIDANFTQGSFVTTGRTFDLGIQGQGFFVVNDGNQNFYTRAGTFGLDSGNDLVDLKNGYKVQSLTGGNISINTTGLFPPKITSTVDMKGNLPAKVEGPLAQVLKTSAVFVDGDPALITGGAGTFNFSAAGTETMTISVNGGAAVTITFEDAAFVDPAAATRVEVAAAINADLAAAGVTGLTASGAGANLTLTTTLTGKNASIKITDGTGTPAATLGLSTSLVVGAEAVPALTTPLNDLPDNVTNYINGDKISIIGNATDGTQINATFTYGTTGTTLGDLITFINTTFSSGSSTGATAALDTTTGHITLTANSTGASKLNLVLSDVSGNTGSTSWAVHAFKVDQSGTGPDQVVTSIPIYDAAGLAHNLTLTFTRKDPSTSTAAWDLQASIPASDGDITTGTTGAVLDIRFNPDGSFKGVFGGSNSISLSFTGQAAQSIQLDFGTSGDTDGLTQFGDQKTAQAQSQDGYAPGTLSTISVRQDGVIQGVYTNGQVQSLGSLGIATFANPAGLQRVQDTLFASSTNAGTPSVSAGTTGAAGAVVSGVLENSNVDVAEEFVKLVEAQRGFQAAAKVIQTTDQMLADLNTIR